jgi:hypothetical protein
MGASSLQTLVRSCYRSERWLPFGLVTGLQERLSGLAALELPNRPPGTAVRSDLDATNMSRTVWAR